MSFTQQIGKWGDKTTKDIQRLRRGIIIKLFGAVIMDTPVRTGRARANWLCSEGEPVLDETGGLDPTGSASLLEVQTVVSPSTGDRPIFLANNLPYIKRLEEGYSQQAPEGMVRRNVARFEELVREEVANG